MSPAAGEEGGDLSAGDEADMDCEYADGIELSECPCNDVCVAAQGCGAGHMVRNLIFFCGLVTDACRLRVLRVLRWLRYWRVLRGRRMRTA